LASLARRHGHLGVSKTGWAVAFSTAQVLLSQVGLTGVTLAKNSTRNISDAGAALFLLRGCFQFCCLRVLIHIDNFFVTATHPSGGVLHAASSVLRCFAAAVIQRPHVGVRHWSADEHGEPGELQVTYSGNQHCWLYILLPAIYIAFHIGALMSLVNCTSQTAVTSSSI
jgi:hypothetical protein